MSISIVAKKNTGYCTSICKWLVCVCRGSKAMYLNIQLLVSTLLFTFTWHTLIWSHLNFVPMFTPSLDFKTENSPKSGGFSILWPYLASVLSTVSAKGARCPSPTSVLCATKGTYRPLMLGVFSGEAVIKPFICVVSCKIDPESVSHNMPWCNDRAWWAHDIGNHSCRHCNEHC